MNHAETVCRNRKIGFDGDALGLDYSFRAVRRGKDRGNLVAQTR